MPNGVSNRLENDHEESSSDASDADTSFETDDEMVLSLRNVDDEEKTAGIVEDRHLHLTRKGGKTMLHQLPVEHGKARVRGAGTTNV